MPFNYAALFCFVSILANTNADIFEKNTVKDLIDVPHQLITPIFLDEKHASRSLDELRHKDVHPSKVEFRITISNIEYQISDVKYSLQSLVGIARLEIHQ